MRSTKIAVFTTTKKTNPKLTLPNHNNVKDASVYIDNRSKLKYINERRIYINIHRAAYRIFATGRVEKVFCRFLRNGLEF